MSRKTLAAACLMASRSPCFAPASSAGTDRSEGLRRAWSEESAHRSVFFIRGMSCRACTMLIDRKLSRQEGVYWQRFNYPLRLMVLYHEPSVYSAEMFITFMAGTGELTAELMESRPAMDARPEKGDPAARWKDGALSLAEAREAPGPFEETLKGAMIEGGTEEWHQVAYEIAGEEVRNRIFRSLAVDAGYGNRGGKVDMPQVTAKDFYWPVERLPLTADEMAVARYLLHEVLGGEESEAGRERFDDWLRSLWKEKALDFRGEVLEIPE